MPYNYHGNAIEGLGNSYSKDKELFLLKDKKFPHRSYGFAELNVLNAIFFPHYWNHGFVTEDQDKLKSLLNMLGELLIEGISPYLDNHEEKVNKIIDSLPEIRELLKLDVEAAFKGDPAAQDYTEIIRAYPGFQAITMQRVAHVMYGLKIPVYPRELTEFAHRLTGIDIHPGAKIGKYFFIDHGNGVVIGETAVIGDWARLYQGVTLGALHFKKGQNGLAKNYKRHPTLGNNVVVGMGAKIVGPVNIGDSVKVGANAWVAEDIESDTTVFISEHPKQKKITNGVKQ